MLLKDKANSKVFIGTIAKIFSVAVFVLSSSLESEASAQIIPDNSLESESSVIRTSVGADNISFELIQGGAKRGASLFHSFEEFNIGDGQGVYFDNPSGVALILSRVTGSSSSNILGTLGVIGGSADLFLINPNGIVFGPDATLDLNGSFIATTANELLFENGYQFEAANSDVPPLLTVAVPVGLQFGETAQGILNQAEVRQELSQGQMSIKLGLEVNPGNTLALIGGNVIFEGGSIGVLDGRIELGSVAGNSQITLQAIDTGWAFNYEDVQDFEDIKLDHRAIDEGGNDFLPSFLFLGGDGDNSNINLQGRNILLQNGSQVINTGITLTVNASETVELVGTAVSVPAVIRSGFAGTTFSDADAGDIIINTRRLVVRDGAFASTESTGQVVGNQGMPASGQGGILSINASESVDLVGEGSRLSARTSGLGSAGSLTINTRRLTVQDGARILTESTGEDFFGQPLATGAGGDATIFAIESIELNNASISTETRGLGGDAGDLWIRTDLLTLRSGATLSAETGSNQGGNIDLRITDLLLLRQNSSISTTAGTTQAGGDGGNINIFSGLIFAIPDENSDITANAFSGRGGRIEITADSILGLEPRSRDELRALLGTDDPAELDPGLLQSSDITAISQENPSLDGEVIISSPDLDLTRGAVELPNRFETPRLSQGCQSSGGSGGRFISSGQGGLTPSPYEPLGGGGIQEDIYPAGEARDFTDAVDHTIDVPTTTSLIQKHESMVEARGWWVNAHGDVILTAESESYDADSIPCYRLSRE